MAKLPRGQTPQRTIEHVIADISVNHVERLFLEAGHSPTAVPKDYGYDLTVQTHDNRGHVESGVIYIQRPAAACERPRAKTPTPSRFRAGISTYGATSPCPSFW